MQMAGQHPVAGAVLRLLVLQIDLQMLESIAAD
jgi:hypothetical protein